VETAVRNERERRLAYAGLWLFGLAFGWIEASTVVYLRDIYVEEAASSAPSGLAGLQVTLVSMPAHLLSLEVAREAATLILLGAVACLAGRRSRDRTGAFLLTFGVWDLVYYGALKLVTGWPQSIRAWDILFLIPAPWVAPVWAPATVALLFGTAGSYLFWTANRPRRYRLVDLGMLGAAALLTLASLLAASDAAIEHRVPDRFESRLFWTGVVLGAAWFVRVERRQDAVARP
jgi:hypothetical protein